MGREQALQADAGCCGDRKGAALWLARSRPARQVLRMTTDESARLDALRSYRILDTEPERAFDDLVFLASQICGTPISLISLIDENRQWFKARIGISEQQTSRSVSFCAHAIRQQGILSVPDALEDARFRDNPLVQGEPHIRFYAGSPLVTPEGHALGTLCVIDRIPRRLTVEQARALDAVRRQVEAQLELRRNLDELQQALAARDHAEAEQAALVRELRESLSNVNRLSALMPYTSGCELNVVIPADPSKIHLVSEGVTQLLESKRWPEEEIVKVDLALQEALANGIRHGCQGDPTKQVQCIVTWDTAGELVIIVRDPGPGFDVTAVADPLDAANVLKPSGRGVFLINQLMDEVEFGDGGRELQMRKRVEPKRED
jgi:anti-sigma regulatory factor (Ser/Thr protein kinase)